MNKTKLEQLIKLRREKNYTCAYMGKRLNMSTAFYCQIENGKRGLYYSMAKKIAKIFNLKPDELFYD